MANKILTFVDASVLIYAATKPTAATVARRMRALQVLVDPDREFLTSDYLRLEVLPIPVCYQKSRGVAFYQKFFTSAALLADRGQLLAPAYDLACLFGLGALDALHLAAAAAHDAEFVSAEKPSKPIYRSYSKSTSIY
jgi:predicted nucleic acid-binding protein